MNRSLVFSILLLAACNWDAPSRNELTIIGEQQQHAFDRIRTLEASAAPDLTPITARLAALEAENVRLRGEVDALRKQGVQKIPHLVAYAGTPKEADIGPNTGDRCAWSDSVGGEVCFGDKSATNVYYKEPNCAGLAFVQEQEPKDTRLVRGTDGSVYAYSRDVLESFIGSLLPDDGRPCINAGMQQRPSQLRLLDKRGSFPVFQPTDLSVTVR